jgi:hypothetical protein
MGATRASRLGPKIRTVGLSKLDYKIGGELLGCP